MIRSIVVAGVVLWAPMSAFAVTVTVDNDLDTNTGTDCSLREAIEVANGITHANCTGDAAQITFGFLGDTAINLSGPLPSFTTGSVDAPIVVDGTGPQIIINGGGNSGGGSVDHGVFTVASGAVVTIKDVVIYASYVDVASHSGIWNEGTVTVDTVTFQSCVHSTAGGALVNVGTATVTGSDFEGSVSGASGAAIDNRGDLHVTASTFNVGVGIASGGAIWTEAAAPHVVTIEHSDLTTNSATYGGAVATADGATLTFSSCYVSGNTATNFGGGLAVSGDIHINDSLIEMNTSSSDGGAIAIAGGNVVVERATLNTNTATNAGGGIYIQAGSAAVLTNLVITGNTAGNSTFGFGGAIFGQGNTNVALNNLTITLNTVQQGDMNAGGGIYFDDGSGGGTVKVQNSIISGNGTLTGPSSSAASDCVHGPGVVVNPTSPDPAHTSLSSLGYNYLGDDSSCVMSTGTDQVGADLKLGTLADNGAPKIGAHDHTLTSIAPASDSAAVNGGNPAGCTEVGVTGTPALVVDIDGKTRPVAVCDAGAIETDTPGSGGTGDDGGPGADGGGDADGTGGSGDTDNNGGDTDATTDNGSGHTDNGGCQAAGSGGATLLALAVGLATMRRRRVR